LLVCDWLHYVEQNHFYVMVFIIQGCYSIQSLHFSSVPLHPSERSYVKYHPSGRRELSVRTSFCVQKLQTTLDYIRPEVSATRPDAFQCSTSQKISFQNTDIGRQLPPSGCRGYSVQTLSLIRQVMQKIFNRRNIRLYGLDAQTLI
jgi:hypothetical protein